MEEDFQTSSFRYMEQLSDKTEFRKGIPLHVQVDMIFLNQLCFCLNNWDFESRERFTSMITAHDAIWTKELNGRSILDWVKDMEEQDYYSVTNELEGRIQQSKLLIQGWCGVLLPLLMQCKPTSTILNHVKKFLSLLHYNLDDVSYAKEMAPFLGNYHIIAILANRIVFVQEKLEYCTEKQDSIEFLGFVSAFSNKIACLTCLYWAKEADIVIDQVNIALFHKMMLEFIPCTLHVTTCYLAILRSTENLHSFLPQETVESFVEFFFGHLDTILKDDFALLRDQLINLIIFITDHPCKNVVVVEEEDFIRSQIYALFREHAYLFLSFDEMKEDLSNNNIILRDFIIKIDIANANLLRQQRYYAFSYSCIGSEAMKMDYSCFVLVQRALCAIDKYAVWALHVQSQLQLYGMELRFLKQSLLWYATLDDSDEEIIMATLSSVIVSLGRIWRSEEEDKGFLYARLDTIHTNEDIKEWYPLAFELEEKIELSKLEISTHLVDEFHWSLEKNKPWTSNKVFKFLDSILHNLNTLVSCRVAKIGSFRKQIETLEDKLTFLQNMLKLIENCPPYSSKNFGEFVMFVQRFANQAARLTILYWVKDAADDNIATEINLMLFHMLQKIKPSTPGVARLYFDTLKAAIYLKPSDRLLFGKTASIFLDFAFEDDPVIHFKDDFQILREDVIFLLTFLNDPPPDEEFVRSQIDTSFWEDVYELLYDDKRDFSEKKVFLGNLMMKINALTAQFRKLYCDFPDSSMYKLPKITSPWYLDSLIQNLRNLKARMIADCSFVPFVKYKIIKYEEELVSLSPFFSYIFELRNELNDTWLEVVDLLHLTERVINSSIRSWFVFDHPIWYYMAYLSDVLDKIKLVKKKLEKIEENNIHNVYCLPHSADVIGPRLKQDWSSKMNEKPVGFDDMARKLIDDLIGEYKPLDIISIVGMGGLGKTTLAREVYNSVKNDFNILAFHTVSEDHNTRTLLLGILKCIMKVDEISGMTNDDMAHKLWQCLSRQKYLIVLDDIWHIRVWNEVKRSLPNNENGSRVVLTTRFYDVANNCKIKSTPFEMPFLSEVHSWELLQKRVFQNGISPPNLYNIGRHIAECCKGLPLSIVVIAGVLARKDRSESAWSEIAERFFSFLSSDGCVKILELSYNHLPEYLKPCLLYLGVFPEDNLYKVNQIVQLWIAEGFVNEHETKSVEDVAKEYFQDLVGRSLIIVSSRGSGGEVKTFIVHDLIQPRGRGIAAASSSMYNHDYRISDAAVAPTVSIGSSSFENASTLLLFTFQAHDSIDSHINNLKLAQVLNIENRRKGYESLPVTSLVYLTSLVNLRHIEYHTSFRWIPSSLSNLWNIHVNLFRENDFEKTIFLSLIEHEYTH